VKLRGGGIKAWSEYLAGHLEVGGRAARGGRRRREKVATVSRRGRKTKLTVRAHLTERREGGSQLRRRESKGKMYFRKYAIDTRAERLRLAYGLRPAGEERPVGAGWARCRVGRKVGRAESKEKEFPN
jgi:hypothetical protein